MRLKQIGSILVEIPLFHHHRRHQPQCSFILLCSIIPCSVFLTSICTVDSLVRQKSPSLFGLHPSLLVVIIVPALLSQHQTPGLPGPPCSFVQSCSAHLLHQSRLSPLLYSHLDLIISYFVVISYKTFLRHCSTPASVQHPASLLSLFQNWFRCGALNRFARFLSLHVYYKPSAATMDIATSLHALFNGCELCFLQINKVFFALSFSDFFYLANSISPPLKKSHNYAIF
ncbi:hypothetical protein Nepgr_013011 [Nepenthes gracilis]|uniref:Uncharacterized protein n=1 Tax=Nepenthes gracilis TaxID=150966 RepID=A0AAD3SI33_NEPGR|nr:hypothetical protein Nepgr_013011 [Nepenthes gracilis]